MSTATETRAGAVAPLRWTGRVWGGPADRWSPPFAGRAPGQGTLYSIHLDPAAGTYRAIDWRHGVQVAGLPTEAAALAWCDLRNGLAADARPAIVWTDDDGTPWSADLRFSLDRSPRGWIATDWTREDREPESAGPFGSRREAAEWCEAVLAGERAAALVELQGVDGVSQTVPAADAPGF